MSPGDSGVSNVATMEQVVARAISKITEFRDVPPLGARQRLATVKG